MLDLGINKILFNEFRSFRRKNRNEEIYSAVRLYSIFQTLLRKISIDFENMIQILAYTFNQGNCAMKSNETNLLFYIDSI